jgi:hypothetical protein
MRRIALLVVATTAVSCTTSAGAMKTAGVASLVAIGGVAIASTGPSSNPLFGPTDRWVGGALLAVGGTGVTVVSLIGAIALRIHESNVTIKPATSRGHGSHTMSLP